jgi:hypothetical protein
MDRANGPAVWWKTAGRQSDTFLLGEAFTEQDWRPAACG